MDEGDGVIELSAMIRELRWELDSAMTDGEGERLRFELGTVEVEATVTVGKEAGGQGKVRFWVVGAGGDGKVTRSDVQKITLTLQPRLAGGAAALIVGDEIPGER
ncbi:trypco2 family protein [Streptomyces sp. NPDC008139]|uniref:trypco2 family protein n=1 Tax=Streptomyces sp. NPDC008139 TaxID=3364814 RepID=UPI0036DFF459